MSIIVDEDKLQVLPSKGKDRKEKEEKLDLRGGLSHLLIRSERTIHTVHRALDQYSRIVQKKEVIKG